MTPERYRHIGDLYHAAMELEPGRRDAFIDEASGGDESLRREVASLIASAERAGSFIESPAIKLAAALIAGEQSGSLIGQHVGHYRIVSLLGGGGMGAVYLAEDMSLLDRDVAIKFLHLRSNADPHSQKRFIREAQAAAELDHPNICAVYEVGRQDDIDFIVMQYVEGETLATRLERQPMEVCESLAIMTQVVEALAEAHAHHIIHRDIKPQNIMITPRGQVKVLDFGLAKLAPTVGADSVTQTQSRISLPGLVIGTAPYMSPQQAKGEPVDVRSDLFSLGAMLYECVGGEPPFSGATPMEICAQVIQFDPPPPSRLNSHVLPELDRVILKALAKEPGRRYQSAGELLSALRAVSAALPGEGQVAGRSRDIKSRTSAVWAKATLPVTVKRPRVFIPVIVAALAILLFFLIVPNRTPHRPPSDAVYWYNVGTRALGDGGYYGASKALEQAVVADDGFALAHARLAEAYTELDNSDKAKDEILRAGLLTSEQPPTRPLEALYLRAITNTVLRDFAPAVESYQLIARQTPENEKAQVYVDLGRAYENNDEIEKAIKSYEEAIRLTQTDAAAFLRLGILYGRQQKPEGAREALGRAETLYTELSNPEGVTEVLYQRGLGLKMLNHLPEARAQLERALEVTTVTSNQYQRIRVLLVLSSVSAAEGEAEQAEQQANHAIELAGAGGMENLAAEGLIWLGNLFLRRGEGAEAEKFYTRALELARRNNGHKNEAWALMQLGSLRDQQHNADEALRYIEPALLFYREGGYRKYLAQGMNLLGRVYIAQGDYKAALQAFEEQLQLAKQVDDLSQIAFSQGEIGSLLAVQERYPEALRYFDEGYQGNKSLNNEFSVGYALMHRGSVLWQLGRNEEAREALDLASSIAERPGSSFKGLSAEIEMTRARLELSLRHFRESQVNGRRALGLASTQFRDIAVQAKYTLGLALARSGEPRAGKLLCEEAVDMAKGTDDPKLLSDALLARAEVMLENSEPQGALVTALQAQARFARFGQQDSEWRAWLTAARAAGRSGEETAGREYATQAETVLSNLTQKWGAEAYHSYLARPDVQHSRKQLGQLLRLQP
ncbi:MAG: protein kinase domain-containing protein [Pyrinomonadaceae bacterium]